MKNLRKKFLALFLIMSMSAANLYCMEMALPEDVKRYIVSIYLSLTFGYSFSFVDQIKLDDNIIFLEFSHEGKSIHAVFRDGQVFRWDLIEEKFIKKSGLICDKEINCFAHNRVKNTYIIGFAPDFTCFCSGDRKEFHVFDFDPDFSISCAAFSADGELAVTAYNEGGGIRLWDTSSKEILKEIPEQGNCWSTAISPDNEKVAYGLNDEVVLYNLKTDEKINLSGCQIAISSLAFSPDGKTILTAGWDGRVLEWDSVSGEKLNQLCELAAIEDMILSVLFSFDGKVANTVLKNGKINFWDIKNGELIKTFEDTQDATWAWMSSDGRNIALLLEDGRLNVWKSLYEPESKNDAFNRVLHLLVP